MASHTFHLSAVDQNTARVYTPTLLVFPFPDMGQEEVAIAALSKGLQTTIRKFPWLAGTLGPVDPTTGKLPFTYPHQVPEVQSAGLFRTKALTRPEYPHTYESLKRNGMPPSALKGEMFCPEVLRRPLRRPEFDGIPSTGEGMVSFDGLQAPAMATQVFFIPGGLVLSIYVHHTLSDCSGVNYFWKHYAQSVRETLGNDSHSMEKIPDQSALRAELDARIPHVAPGHIPAVDAYINGTYEYTKTLPDDTACSQRLFIIPASRIRSFREELKPFFPYYSPTICNVISALVWIHVTRARVARLLKSGNDEVLDQETNLGIAMDLRKKLSPPLGEEYMGNMANFAKSTLNIADLVSEDSVTKETIIPAIRRIREAISKTDNDWCLKQLTFFNSINPITDTECALGFRFGLDLYITSWMNFGAEHEWNIPGTTWGMPEFIRRVYNPSDGGMMILPRRRNSPDGVEAPYEVMVRLAGVDMDTLLSEPGGLASWADRVLD